MFDPTFGGLAVIIVGVFLLSWLLVVINVFLIAADCAQSTRLLKRIADSQERMEKVITRPPARSAPGGPGPSPAPAAPVRAPLPPQGA